MQISPPSKVSVQVGVLEVEGAPVEVEGAPVEVEVGTEEGSVHFPEIQLRPVSQGPI